MAVNQPVDPLQELIDQASAQDPNFHPGGFQGFLEDLYPAIAGPAATFQPRGFLQGLASGAARGFAGQGQRVAKQRAKFEADQIARNAKLDQARIAEAQTKATQAGQLENSRTLATEADARKNIKLTQEQIDALPEGSGLRRIKAGSEISRDTYEKAMSEKSFKQQLAEAEAMSTVKARGTAAGKPEEPAGVDLSDPATLDMVAWTYRKTGQLPPLGNRKEGVAERNKIITRAAHLPADFVPIVDMPQNMADYKSNASALKGLVELKANADAYIGTFDRNANVLLDTAKSVPGFGAPLFNQPLRPLLAKLGSRKVAEFDAARQILVPEAARILNAPNMKGVLTNEARQELNAVISGNFNYNQLEGVIEILRRDTRNRASSYQSVIDDLRSSGSGGTGASDVIQPALPGGYTPTPGTFFDKQRPGRR